MCVNMSFDDACAAALCHLAYQQPDVVLTAYSSKQGPAAVLQAVRRYISAEPVFFSHEPTNTQAYIFTLPDGNTAIAVRGTDTLSDALYDKIICLVDSGDGKVHEGFLIQFHGLYEALRAHIIQSKPSTIYVTGHSAGAAIGALVARRLCGDLGGATVTFTGLGCPRFADAAFATSLKKAVGEGQVKLIKSARDPITKMMSGPAYTELCAPAKYGRQDLYPTVPLLSDMPDHFIEEYVKAISGKSTQVENWWTKFLRFIATWAFEKCRS